MNRIIIPLIVFFLLSTIQILEAQQSDYLILIEENGIKQYTLKFDTPSEALQEEVDQLNLKLREIDQRLKNNEITKRQAKELSEAELDKASEAIELLGAKQEVQEWREELVEKLETYKEQSIKIEKRRLKNKVAKINERLANGEITKDVANDLKAEDAKRHALNIENITAISDNKIELVKRGENIHYGELLGGNQGGRFGFSIGEKGEGALIGVHIPKRYVSSSVKYDVRTTNDLLFAFGLNNAIIDGQGLDDSPYKIGKSWFFELGWSWKTRVFKDSNFLRFKYGFAFQWNKYQLKDDMYFVRNGSSTNIEPFPTDLKKSKFRTTNLVFPLHLEFGPSHKLEKKDRIRYINNDKFKFGIGGYAGFNIGSKQKLKFEEDGETVRQKTKGEYNVSPFVYGLSSYIGFGDTSLYVKYDLSETFKDNSIKQNNISLGIRFDID